MAFSFLRITSSAGQKSYPSISSTLIQRISLCSNFWGVPSRIDALNKVEKKIEYHKLMNSGIKEAERIIAEQKADTKV